MKTKPYRILVVYYTQTGQLKHILDALCLPLQQNDTIELEFAPIEPENDYPFPWQGEFFDCFPESVEGIPIKLKPLKTTHANYDLVIFGYQPWYLSPSVPASSFLQSEQAATILKDTPVITVIGSRNMWIGAQNIVAQRLKSLGAKLVGNIVRVDRTNNWIAGITIISWLTNGKKKTKLFPEAGVSSTDIAQSGLFGKAILECIEASNFDNLQKQIVSADGIPFKFKLYAMEKNARKIFQKFATFIIKADNKPIKRKRRITLFKYYLLFVFFIISPVASFVFMTVNLLFPNRIRKIRTLTETVE